MFQFCCYFGVKKNAFSQAPSLEQDFGSNSHDSKKQWNTFETFEHDKRWTFLVHALRSTNIKPPPLLRNAA